MLTKKYKICYPSTPKDEQGAALVSKPSVPLA